MKTSHKKNRPFDFKLIDLVEPHAVLYQRHSGLSPFDAMKAKNAIWEDIAKEMEASTQFCITRWSNLRGQYQKELRHCRELCPKEGVIRGSNWPYLQRLSFLENTIQFNKSKTLQAIKRQQKKRSKKNSKHISNEKVENVLSYACDSVDAVANNAIDDLMSDEFYIIEEQDECEYSDISNRTQQANNGKISHTNLKKMSTLLLAIEGENRARIERRIMAFLCKCQLRALTNGTVDDLDV